MRYLLVILASIMILSMLSQVAKSQQVRGFELGISLLSGKNFYDRKYYGQDVLPPGKETKIKSKYLLGAGILAEKYMTSHFSSLVELMYTQVDVPTNTLCDCNYRGNIWLQDEKHHWGALAAGIRYKLNPKSVVTIFADGKLKGDWLIASSIKNDDEKKINWHAFGYRRFAPSVEFSLGAKWKRISMNVGYHTNVARTFTRDAGEYDQVVHPFKTGFLIRGIFAKVSINAFKFD